MRVGNTSSKRSFIDGEGSELGRTSGGRELAVGGGVGVAMGTLGRDASGCDGSDCIWIDCDVLGSVRGASRVWSSRDSWIWGGAGRGFNRIGIVGSWRSTTFDSGTRRGAAGALGAGRDGGWKRPGGRRGGGGKR